MNDYEKLGEAMRLIDEVRSGFDNYTSAAEPDEAMRGLPPKEGENVTATEAHILRRTRPSALPEVRVEWSDGGQQYAQAIEGFPISVTPESRCGLHARIYRQQAGGVTRVVVSLVGGMGGPKLLEGLSISVGGVAAVAPYTDGRWALDPGQAIHTIGYCDENGFFVGLNGWIDASVRFWSAYAADHFKPVPKWAPEKLRKKALELLGQEYLGPFQPGLTTDPTGAGPGADFGVAVASEETWLCAEGFALMEIYSMQVLQRDRSFWCDENGDPRWAPYAPYWSTWQHRDYKVSAEQYADAVAWWPEYAQMARLQDFDDQHSARAWRGLVPLAQAGDPWAKWCLEHRWNRSAHQWCSDQDNATNPLLRDVRAALSRGEAGHGTPEVGRAGCWAWRLAQVCGNALTCSEFGALAVRASNHGTGEIHADTAHGYASWARAELGLDAPLSMTHEMALSVMVRRLSGNHACIAGAETLAELLAKNAHKGKAKVFGKDKWAGKPLGYVPAIGGNLDEWGGAEGLLAEAEKRDPLSDAQPLLSVPRCWYEHLLVKEVPRGE